MAFFSMSALRIAAANITAMLMGREKKLTEDGELNPHYDFTKADPRLSPDEFKRWIIVRGPMGTLDG
jgi:hypothetical protein